MLWAIHFFALPIQVRSNTHILGSDIITITRYDHQECPLSMLFIIVTPPLLMMSSRLTTNDDIVVIHLPSKGPIGSTSIGKWLFHFFTNLAWEYWEGDASMGWQFVLVFGLHIHWRKSHLIPFTKRDLECLDDKDLWLKFALLSSIRGIYWN